MGGATHDTSPVDEWKAKGALGAFNHLFPSFPSSPPPNKNQAPMDNANDENDRGDPLRMSTSLASNKEGFLGFASGLVAGVIGVLTGYPLDTLKVCSRNNIIHSSLLLLCRPACLHAFPSDLSLTLLLPTNCL